MTDGFLGDALEQIKEIPKETVKQAVSLPTDIGKGVVEQIVTGSSSPQQSGGGKVDPLTGIEIPSKAQIRKLKKREGKIKTAGLSQVRKVISLVKPASTQSASLTPDQLPSYITGKPEFSKERKKEEKKLPPPVLASKHKMGTSERRLGVSG